MLFGIIRQYGKRHPHTIIPIGIILAGGYLRGIKKQSICPNAKLKMGPPVGNRIGRIPSLKTVTLGDLLFLQKLSIEIMGGTMP